MATSRTGGKVWSDPGLVGEWGNGAAVIDPDAGMIYLWNSTIEEYVQITTMTIESS